MTSTPSASSERRIASAPSMLVIAPSSLGTCSRSFAALSSLSGHQLAAPRVALGVRRCGMRRRTSPVVRSASAASWPRESILPLTGENDDGHHEHPRHRGGHAGHFVSAAGDQSMTRTSLTQAPVPLSNARPALSNPSAALREPPAPASQARPAQVGRRERPHAVGLPTRRARLDARRHVIVIVVVDQPVVPEARIASMIGSTRDALVGQLVLDRGGDSGIAAAHDDPCCSSMCSRSESVRGLIPGQACSSWVKRRGPSERSWTISEVHFEPIRSEVAATAQQVPS